MQYSIRLFICTKFNKPNSARYCLAIFRPLGVLLLQPQIKLKIKQRIGPNVFLQQMCTV
jgi:hypothetical protein